MSATADKARFFLEQSVSELKELERKKIFTPQEITAVAKKRSDFEHKINARGSSPTDYAQYAEFEINVDVLRKKRIKRLGVKATTHNGQRRIFFVFDRGTRKFPGDLKLWMQAIEYARGQKALKKVSQTLTNVLRLHPAKAELWIYAAQFALMENGDMTEARAYMQRGLRFCKHSQDLWLQNFRLEMNWIGKIYARRQILGIENDARKNEVKIIGEDDNVMRPPKVTAQDIDPDGDQDDKVDVTALEHLDSTPILTGAIPIAIFDAAMTQFDNESNFALKFFEEVAAFQSAPATVCVNISRHIDDLLQKTNLTSWHASAAHISMVTRGVGISDPEFPSALREALSKMVNALARTAQRDDLREWCLVYLNKLAAGDLDPALKQILQSKIQALS